jgi:TetR/AcrR family transcriptional repressor of nem operon
MSRKRMGTTTRGRQATKQETREALIAAALAEFAAHGLDTPSLDAICARAGFTRGAFYVHFRDRDDLMVAVVEHALAAFLDAMIATGDEARDLARTVDRFAGAVAATLAAPGGRISPILPLPESVPFARVLDAVTRSPRLRASFTTLLEGAIERLSATTAHGQRAGTVRGDVDARQVAFLLTMVALGVMAALDARLAIDAEGARAAVSLLLEPPGAAPRAQPRAKRGRRPTTVRTRRRRSPTREWRPPPLLR